jgi:hypothetical protein
MRKMRLAVYFRRLTMFSGKQKRGCKSEGLRN